jgi:hypothetical protein
MAVLVKKEKTKKKSSHARGTTTGRSNQVPVKKDFGKNIYTTNYLPTESTTYEDCEDNINQTVERETEDDITL